MLRSSCLWPTSYEHIRAQSVFQLATTDALLTAMSISISNPPTCTPSSTSTSTSTFGYPNSDKLAQRLQACFLISSCPNSPSSPLLLLSDLHLHPNPSFHFALSSTLHLSISTLHTALDHLQSSSPTQHIHSGPLVQITFAALNLLFDHLLRQSFLIRDQIDYWSSVQSDRLYALSYFIQTVPSRLFKLAQQSSLPLQAAQLAPEHSLPIQNLLPSSPTRSTSWSAGLYNHLSRPQLLLSGLFPLLRSSFSNAPNPASFFATLSPVLLTRQESRLKREQLEQVHDQLAEQIGRLVAALHTLEHSIEHPPNAAPALSELLASMLKLTDVAAHSPDQAGLSDNLKRPGPVSQLRQLLSSNLPNHQAALQTRIAPLSPPSLVTRNWPWLVSLPLGAYTLARLAYTYRQAIIDALTDARETVKGFVFGWVVKPLEDILQTLKAGEQGTLALMGKDSLASELDSLERMTVELGREQFKWGEDELGRLSRRVREGDLTAVLKIWEQEIKTPIRSALAGSLIRVLLIQIQKVKVDLSLAMDGIQSILRSQSLTIGAIGVAPSMLICFLFGKLFGVLVRRRLGVVGKGTKAVRREVRMAMRRLERSMVLVSSNPTEDAHHASVAAHQASPDRTLGLLFLDLHLLRVFARSGHFPRRDSSRTIRDEFVADVEDLEDLDLSWSTKRKLAKRFVRQWGYLVKI